jgi:hypothetical protein
MTPEELPDQTLAGFNQSLGSGEALFQPGKPPVRDDSSLCFLCLRWTSGDHDCRNGIRCDLQLIMDQLENLS